MEIPEMETWWPALKEDVRRSLTANPNKSLSAEEVVAITQARGIGPTGSRWVGEPADSEFFLTYSEQEWVRNNT